MKTKLVRIVSLVLAIATLASTLIFPAYASSAKPADGEVYYIQSAIGENFVIDCARSSKEDRANVEMWSLHTGKNQQIKLKYVGNGYYALQFVHSGKVLDVKGGSTAPGANVHQWKWENNPNQLFKFIDAGDGYYYIQVKNSGLYLDIQKGNTAPGANLIVYTPQKSDNQKFRLIPVSSNPLDLKINSPSSVSLAPGKTTTMKFTFSGKRIESASASLTGGLTGGFLSSNWNCYPGTCEATIQITAPKNFTSGSVTFNLLLEGLTIKTVTVPVSYSSSKISTAQIQSVLNKYGYKNGTYWTSMNASNYKASTKPGGSSYWYAGSTECAGFVLLVMGEVTNVSDPTVSSKWKRLSGAKNVSSLCVGDIVRAGGHSAIVLSCDANGKCTFAEVWGSYRNEIHIGGPFNGSYYTLADIKKAYPNSFSHVWRYVG